VARRGGREPPEIIYDRFIVFKSNASTFFSAGGPRTRAFGLTYATFSCDRTRRHKSRRHTTYPNRRSYTYIQLRSLFHRTWPVTDNTLATIATTPAKTAVRRRRREIGPPPRNRRPRCSKNKTGRRKFAGNRRRTTDDRTQRYLTKTRPRPILVYAQTIYV